MKTRKEGEMIDTIHLHLPSLSEQEIQIVTDRRERRKTKIDENTGVETRYGEIRNMRVYLNGKGLLVKGSLAKFYKGNNCDNFLFSEVKSAVGELQESMGINISNAVVKRLDMGINVMLCEPVERYLEMLGLADGYKRNRWDNTVYYYTHKTVKGSKRVIAFYNKIDEAVTKREKVPVIYQGLNLLRYELRFMREPAKQFGMGKISMSSLTDKKFWEVSLRRLVSEYEGICKEGKLLPLISSKVNGPRDCLYAFADYGIIVSGGLTAAVKRIDSDRQMEAQKRYECKRWIKKRWRSIQESPVNDLMQELDEKMKHAIGQFSMSI